MKTENIDLNLFRLKLRDSFDIYSREFLKIRSKSDGIVPFGLNKVQIHLHQIAEKQKKETGKVRIIVLKGRQQGCSTYISGRFFWLVSHHTGKRVFILTHDHDATNNLFAFANRFYENLPHSLQPHTSVSNVKEIYFDYLDSGYKVGTAGNKAVGRSDTIQYLHGSEVAYWPCAEEHAKGILQAVPNESGTEIFLESTANGVNNYFHEMWQMAHSESSGFIPVFLPWWWQDEYQSPVTAHFVLDDYEKELIATYGLKNEQIMWRRGKMSEYGIRNAEKAFMQEYPCCAEEAFQTSGGETFISPAVVVRARHTRVESDDPLIIGVDPAASGADRTAIIRRRGRKSYKLQVFEKLTTSEIVGIIHKIIESEKPFKVCVDKGSFGIGIVDSLHELGHSDIVIGINFSESALDPEKFFNRRSEMWGLLKLWLQDEPVEIPDDNALHADLCSYNYDETEHTDHKGRLKLEKKALLKKRNVRSPDCADALALTFSVPYSMLRRYNNQNETRKASIVMARLQRRLNFSR